MSSQERMSGPTVHKTKRELAIEGIRAAIFRGDVSPGSRLTVAELSEILGMSATPIREAIGVLEADGLIVSEPHRGIRVTQMTAAEAWELALLRAPMEGLATRLGVPNLTVADLDELAALQEEMVTAVDEGDDEALTQANAAWHRLIYAAGQTTFVFRHIMRLWIPYPWRTIWGQRTRGQSLRQHAEIMAAIASGDADRAGELMHEHILTSCRAALDELQAREGDTALVASG